MDLPRHFSRGILTAAAGFALLVLGAPSWVNAQGRAAWERIDAATELLDGATPRAGSIRLDLPAVTQDGSSVPVTVEVDHPMNPDDHVEALYLFAAGNPSPEVAEIHFTPLAGKARITTRIRLDGSQTVVALARTNRGEWLAGQRDVRVTVSGCLSQGNSSDNSDFMQARVRPPSRMAPGEPGEVRTLINHPMETGLRKNPDGSLIPERIIEEFRAELDGEKLLAARFHRAVSANPYLLFFVAPGRHGELALRWEEGEGAGESATATASIPD